MVGELEKTEFQQTEVDGIPSDWEVTPIGKYAKLINGRAYALHEWETKGIPVIRLQNLTGRGENFYYSNLNLPEKQYCHFGDLLFMWSATFGPVIWRGKKAIYHYHIWKVETDDENLDKLLLYYILEDLTERVKKSSTNGGTMLHLTKGGMERMLIPLPPTKVEQTAIATALTDADALITQLEQLIAKKKAIKQGAMQELLKPKEGWVEKKLGELIELSPSKQSLKKDDSVVFLGMEDVSEDGKIKNQNLLLNYEVKKGLTAFKRNDVLIAKITPCFENGKGACLDTLMRENGYGSTEFHVLRTNEKSIPRFVFYHSQTSNFRRQLEVEMVGTAGQKRVSSKSIINYLLPVPAVAEQTRIAQILSDMDAEIDKLEQQLTKQKMLKQGMMQVLLTGKIRLV